jgi:hypothetical protein
MTEPSQSERWWTVQRGFGPIVATAIHDGHELREEVAAAMKLSDADRLREEDPFTGQAIVDVPTHIIAHRSRFEFDLNRDPQKAVYRTPDQSWGLEVWHGECGEAVCARSVNIHAAYYRMMATMLDDVAAVIIAMHVEPAPQAEAPDINIGTFSMPREQWAFLLDPLMDAMRGFDFNGRHLDVRENVAFQGKGEQARFVHERYPGRGCAIALEFKKFFMDEWTGEPDRQELDTMRRFITSIANTARELLQ